MGPTVPSLAGNITRDVADTVSPVVDDPDSMVTPAHRYCQPIPKAEILDCGGLLFQMTRDYTDVINNIGSFNFYLLKIVVRNAWPTPLHLTAAGNLHLQRFKGHLGDNCIS